MTVFFYWNPTKNQNLAQCFRTVTIHVGSQLRIYKKFLIKHQVLSTCINNILAYSHVILIGSS